MRSIRNRLERLEAQYKSRGETEIGTDLEESELKWIWQVLQGGTIEPQALPEQDRLRLESLLNGTQIDADTLAFQKK